MSVQLLLVIACKKYLLLIFFLLFLKLTNNFFFSWENRKKSLFNNLIAFVIVGHLIFNALFAMFLLCLAGLNYPGGMAIARLHRLEKDVGDPVYVHIDVLTAQTGVSRFTQTNPSWK